MMAEDGLDIIPNVVSIVVSGDGDVYRTGEKDSVPFRGDYIREEAEEGIVSAKKGIVFLISETAQEI